MTNINVIDSTARLAVVVWCLLLCQAVCTSVSAAETSRFEARLIWGTDGEKPSKPPLKDIDGALAEKLRGIFKWKNYFEVNRKVLAPSKSGTLRAVLSEKAEVEVRELDNNNVEVSLFGEGKHVKKIKQPVTNKLIVIAGDDKNDTAWFVIITPPTAKSP